MRIVITGISSGIGLALTKVALNKGHQVLGIARNPDKSEGLKQLKANYSEKLELLSLDLLQEDTPQKIQKALGSEALDLLINNAGIYEKEETSEAFLKSFQVNSIAPFQVTKGLLKNLKKSDHPKVIHVSSMMGSIADNNSGGAYAYRASKAALNMINKCLTVENSWLTSIVVHPGWVQTRMGGEEAPVKPDASAEGIWHVMEKLSQNESGNFYDYQGKHLPW